MASANPDQHVCVSKPEGLCASLRRRQGELIKQTCSLTYTRSALAAGCSLLNLELFEARPGRRASFVFQSRLRWVARDRRVERVDQRDDFVEPFFRSERGMSVQLSGQLIGERCGLLAAALKGGDRCLPGHRLMTVIFHRRSSRHSTVRDGSVGRLGTGRGIGSGGPACARLWRKVASRAARLARRAARAGLCG
jgi:hypothetical protein